MRNKLSYVKVFFEQFAMNNDLIFVSPLQLGKSMSLPFFPIQILDVNGRRRLCPFFGDWNVSNQILTLHGLLDIS